MTRTSKTLMTACLGALLLTSVACENKETEVDLSRRVNLLGSAQRRL